MNESELRNLMLPDDGLPTDRHDRIKERVMATIQTKQPSPQRRVAPLRLPRRLVPVLVSMLVMVVAATSAAALGLFPWQAQDILQEVGCRDGSSIDRLVATQEASDGRTFEFWTTSGGADGAVNGHTVIELDADGNYAGMGSGCGEPGYEAEADEAWATYQAEYSASESLLTVIGRVPPQATVVDITLSDGTSTRIDVQTDGYFLGLVYGPGVDMGSYAEEQVTPELVHLTATDTLGTIIADLDLP